MSTTDNDYIRSLRRIVWPIEGYEHKKFLPMAFMMLCILLNYSTLRSIKDGFIVTEIGAEALGFLKTFAVLPSAILFMIIYSKLCNLMSNKNVFYTVTSFFIAFFAFYTYILYPYPDTFHPNAENIQALATKFPNFQWLIRIAGKWSYATLYIFSELWGSVMISVLFWSFANMTTKPDEAKRFYSMYGVIGNIGLILTSVILSYFLNPDLHLVSEHIRFTPIFTINILCGVTILFLYWWVNKYALTDPRLYDGPSAKAKKNKVKLSVADSFRMIFSSKYLGLIAILVISYGVSVNLVEGVWKSKIRELYPSKEEYTMYMAGFQKWQGISAILFMFVGANILRMTSWKVSAFFTPIMILVTGLIFFGFIFFGDAITKYSAGMLTVAPLALAVLMGSIQNILSKATKYSLFDATKEMTYIPLNEDLQTKGKSAVELIGGRAGKTGGGIIQAATFMMFPLYTFTDAIPLFASLFFLMLLFWLYSIGVLSKLYESQLKLWKEQKAQEKTESQLNK